MAGCEPQNHATVLHSPGRAHGIHSSRRGRAPSTGARQRLAGAEQSRWARTMHDAASPPRPDEPFLVTRTGGSGLTRGQSRSVRFATPSAGVRLVRLLPPDAYRAAAVLGAGPDAVLTDLSAARHWQLPLPPWLAEDPSAITVSRPAGGGRPERRDTRGRRVLLPDGHVTSLNGVRITTPARTWLDCAAHLPLVDVVALGDHVLRLELAREADLGALIDWAPRRRGIVTARTALPLLDPRSESPRESVVRAHLVQFGLPRPVCNLDVFHDGAWLARVDLAWPQALLAVEYDGMGHLDEGQRRRDAWRRNALQRAGWLVITLTADDLRHPHLMCRRIAETLAGRTSAR